MFPRIISYEMVALEHRETISANEAFTLRAQGSCKSATLGSTLLSTRLRIFLYSNSPSRQ